MKKAILFITLLIPILSIAQRFNEIDIPMRDGMSLAADIYKPSADKTYSTILIQTPYNKNLHRLIPIPLTQSYDIDQSDYVIIIVDWRCRFASADACGAQNTRGEDGYDLVEWIAQQSWSNGKVGSIGASALGAVQYETAREQPPHLVCASPEVAAPFYHYNQYYPGGVYRVEYLETLNELFPGYGSSLILSNPYYNNIWRSAENATMYPSEIKVPMLLVSGWFDINTEDNFNMLDTLMSSSDISVRNKHKIIIGPWVHGGLSFFGQETGQQGQLNFSEAQFANTLVQKQFFDYHLLDRNNGWSDRETYSYFQMGENVWRQSDQWPEGGGTTKIFYLNQDNALQLSTPLKSSSSHYTYNPENPSPTIGGKTLSKDLDQGPFDQLEVEERNDNLIFTSDIITSNLAINGSVKVHLKVASDRLDTDFAVRLTDVYPDGRSILIGESIQRMRYRNGNMLSDMALMNPSEKYDISIKMDYLAHTFLPDHQIRLIITSSNYPRYNRNMNNGEKDQYPNNDGDAVFKPMIATNSIYFGPNASWVELPTTTRTTSLYENKVASKIIIFPNPTNDFINLSFSDKVRDVQIHDITGKLVVKKTIANQAIDVSNLKNGVYFITVKEGNEIELGKFVKI